MAATVLVRQLWDSPRFWRRTALALATIALALLVAAGIARPPPDFSELRVAAVLRDRGGQPGWSVRLARAADQIAVDGLGPPPPPAGKTYQLWLAAGDGSGPQPLGLLPRSGRKIFAEAPANIRRLAKRGAALWVTLEPASGEISGTPTGTPAFRADLGRGG